MKNKETIDSIFYKKLGNILHRERKKRGYSLRYVAELTGISRTTIDKYEMGTTRIDSMRWQSLCKALQISHQLDMKILLGIREYD